MSSNTSFSTITSHRYAQAIYELAEENSDSDKIEDEVNAIKNLIKINSEFRTFISNPIISKSDQMNVVQKILDTFKFSKTIKKTLGFLCVKGRLFFLKDIIDSLLQLISQNKGELQTELVSSKALSDAEIEEIKNELSEDFKAKIKINYKHDPNLMGGLILKVGSIMVDTSIKNKLKRLEKAMVGK